MPWWLSAPGATVLEKFSLGSCRNHSGPPTGDRMIIRLEGPFMYIETATQSADQIQYSPGPRTARHLWGMCLQVILGMCPFWRTCNRFREVLWSTSRCSGYLLKCFSRTARGSPSRFSKPKPRKECHLHSYLPFLNLLQEPLHGLLREQSPVSF